jgi:hypothetical protein
VLRQLLWEFAAAAGAAESRPPWCPSLPPSLPADVELKRHIALEHGDELKLTRAQRREAMTIPLQFQYRDDQGGWGVAGGSGSASRWQQDQAKGFTNLNQPQGIWTHDVSGFECLTDGNDRAYSSFVAMWRRWLPLPCAGHDDLGAAPDYLHQRAAVVIGGGDNVASRHGRRAPVALSQAAAAMRHSRSEGAMVVGAGAGWGVVPVGRCAACPMTLSLLEG